MLFRIIQFALLLAVAIFVARFLVNWVSELFSDTKPCPRCEGKGYWLNTRNRERCEWCQGSGRLPKNLEV